MERIDEYRGILHTRRHLAATPIFKGIPNFRQTRIAMLRAETVDELTGILEDCRRMLAGPRAAGDGGQDGTAALFGMDSAGE